MHCDEPTFLFPMKADIYYPIITQNNYGQPSKEWVYDRTIICNAEAYARKGAEELDPQAFMKLQNLLIARTSHDPRSSSQEKENSPTTIMTTTIRDKMAKIIYKETAGPRSGRGTIYEVATVEPFVGPFGGTEYFKMVWRRAENQAVSD